MARILVIDDEPHIRRFMRVSLAANGHQVTEAENAALGVSSTENSPPDLVILDLGLPDLDGQEVITAIRTFSAVPIIVLSLRSSEADKVEALDRGANDYVVKPFGVAELMARIRAVLRQYRPSGEVLEIGSLRLDFERRRITRDGAEVRLSRREYDLLQHFVSNPDQVLTHKSILKALWGDEHTEHTAYLRIYVNQLRAKLEEDPANPKLIITEPGVGYRLCFEAQHR